MNNNNELTLKFSVEKTEDNHLLVRKTQNNTDYQVKLLVFTKEDIESYQQYQKEIYDEINLFKSMQNKALGFFGRIFG